LKIDDISLWQSFLEGDRLSFQNIYTLYFNVLYEYGMRRVGNEELVKDCIQDLFVKLWTNRRTIATTAKIKYYLLGALKNHLINAGTSPSFIQMESVEAADHFTLDFSADTDFIRRQQDSRLSLRLQEALRQLTPRQKEIIYLRFFEELSYDEIAQLMDISVKGAYKLSHRALETLKQVLSLSQKDLLLFLMLCRFH
jgi:RNA polymerase sigma factor (sigma-70 family)